MSDVAVLLNLTPRLTFEETDPLMGLVTGGDALLFYDQLSVEKVQVETDQGLNYLKERVVKLRNLLESRALSKDDDNERIRLIITLDLVGGILQPVNNPELFPAQQARETLQIITELFGAHNPLLRRLHYCFIFVYSNTRINELSQFFSLNAKRELDAEEFRGNCNFFFMKADNTPLKVKRTDETFIKSLIQLISTMSSRQFDAQLQAPGTQPANVFVAGDNDRNHIVATSFGALNGMVGTCKPLLNSQSWHDDREVSYATYAAISESSTEIDSYTSLNTENDKLRTELCDRFGEACEPPFFFAQKPGDWQWYNEVLKAADAVYQFEQEHERPLYEEPKRLTEKEMVCRTQKCTYAELEERMRELSKTELTAIKPKDLDGYLSRRHQLLDDFHDHIGKLRKEMRKLGFLSSLLWISILFTLVFTLCFAFHFFLPGNTDKPYWIVACLIAIAMLFVGSALIGGAVAKAKVIKVYDQMNHILEQLRDHLIDYLASVKKSREYQRKADVLKRNLDEMKAKLNEFDRHNKRVEIWMHHYDGLVEKLNNAMETFDVPAEHADNAPAVSKTSTVFHLDAFPSLPNAVSTHFKDMSTRLIHNGPSIEGVTCFVNQFGFVLENP